jgi:hypothetical protein
MSNDGTLLNFFFMREQQFTDPAARPRFLALPSLSQHLATDRVPISTYISFAGAPQFLRSRRPYH